MELNRHEIREKALQSLFPLAFDPSLATQTTIQNALLLDSKAQEDESAELPVPNYLTELVEGVLAHSAELDQQIQRYLKSGWQLNRIAKTDLMILRIALYEMNYQADVPDKVALNEALELAKKYSDDEARRFVNGVLSAVVLEKSSMK